jgi:hypothetical protein
VCLESASVSNVRPGIICIVGMHRSGSSLTANLLLDNGVPSGRRLIGGTAFNKKGHFEDRVFVNINKKILKAFGGSWDEPPEFPLRWQYGASVGRLLESARRYKRNFIDGRQGFFFKDPRTCLTLPFWKEALGPMRYLVVLRNPEGCASSILRRNREFLSLGRVFWRSARFVCHSSMGAYERIKPITHGAALMLWYRYYDQALIELRGQDVYVACYEDLLEKPRETTNGILKWVFGQDVNARADAVDKVLCSTGLSSKSEQLLDYVTRFSSA